MGKNIYINRELSWLRFNERVLEEAEDASLPLLERLKFISIFGTNLDEFFMVRFGSLYDMDRADPRMKDNKSEMTAREQMDAICASLPPLVKRKDKAYKQILKLLAAEGVRKIDFSKITSADESLLKKYFRQEVLGLLSPQIVSAKHSFPFLKNNATYVAVQLKSKSGDLKLGLVPTDTLERIHFVHSKSGSYFVLTEELVYHFADIIFSGYTFVNHYLIRVTRNADLDVAEASFDEELNWRDIMCELLRRRKGLAAVRLQTNKPFSKRMQKFMLKNLRLRKNQIVTEKSSFDTTFAFRLENIFRKRLPHLLHVPQQPLYPENIDTKTPIHLQAQEKDLLLCYPFQSIRPFIRLLEEAADDPDTTSIKITLYRVASDSQLLAALLKAVENGKEVTAVLELRARFDEQNNIDWSRRLEAAGCHIQYGLEKYKVHSKILLITRKTEDGYAYTTQIGTGNYNEKTAELYTDLCMITADREIALEVKNVFDHLALGETVEHTDKLLVAPKCMLPVLEQKIDAQIRRALRDLPASVCIKCNAITDKQLIGKLIEASQAGVKIKLFVRGICCLRAGVRGVTENITVKSIVGRYLEHSRIYMFGSGEESEIYISSADFMTRNTQNRVEVAAPVLDAANKQLITDMFDLWDQDNVKTRIMQPDGTYVRFENGCAPVDSQMWFFELFGGQPASVLKEKIETEKAVNLDALAEDDAPSEEKKMRPMIEDAERSALLQDLEDLRSEAEPKKKKMPLWVKILLWLLVGGSVCAATIYYVIVHLGWNFWLI